MHSLAERRKRKRTLFISPCPFFTKEEKKKALLHLPEFKTKFFLNWNSGVRGHPRFEGERF